MNTFSLETLTADTLADAYALHPDPAQVPELLEGARTRIAAGQLRPEQFLVLRSGRGVEATLLVPANARAPLFPRYRAETPPDILTDFFRLLRQKAPGRTLLLDDSLVTLRPDEALAAGWMLDSTNVTYQTDLSTVTAAPDPAAQPLADVSGAEAQALLAALDRADLDLEEEDTLLGLRDGAGQLVGLGLVAPSNRPGWANLDLIGVQPDLRGRGYGQRLHAQMLRRAALSFTHHGGQTDAENHAMRRIYERNGSRHTGTQLYFRAE